METKRSKKVIFTKAKNVDKILVSKKEDYDLKKSIKYFIGYNDNNVIRPLCIKLPQMVGYVKCFDSNKTMSFKVSDKKLLKEYTKIWGRVSSLIEKKFGSEPVYGDSDKYIKTKIKSYRDKINTNFQGKKAPKENSSYKYLSMVMLDSVIRVNKKYYPQTLLEECKYEMKKNTMENNINDDFDLGSSDESDNKPDSESDSEPDIDESDSESNNESKNPFKKSDSKSKNLFEKSDNESKNPFKKSDNKSKNPFEKSDNESKNPEKSDSNKFVNNKSER